MRGRLLMRRLKLDQNECPLYGIAGCPLLRGFECIEVYGDTIRTFRNVRYNTSVCRWGVSIKRGSTVGYIQKYSSCITVYIQTVLRAVFYAPLMLKLIILDNARLLIEVLLVLFSPLCCRVTVRDGETMEIGVTFEPSIILQALMPACSSDWSSLFDLNSILVYYNF